MEILNILLQAQEGAQGSGMMNIIMIVLMIVVFYFFMIRPQQKKQKELQNFQNSLTKGSKVLTASGVYGKITGVADNYFMVEIANNVEIKVQKSSVYPTNEETK